MRHHSQQKFNPDMPLVARRPFVFSGKAFQPGQKFRVEDDNVRRARQLYERRFLRLADNREKVVFKQGNGLRVVMRSPGWYDVMGADDKVLNDKPLRKGKAEEFAREHAS